MAQFPDDSHSLPTRRAVLGQLAAASAVLANPRLLHGLVREPAFGEIQSGPVTLPASFATEDSGQTAALARWSTKTGPLMTRWSAQVDPKMPHPGYPRPQLVRPDWLNLNGVWEYQPGSGGSEAPPFGKQLASTILVPFGVESALSGVMEHHDRIWYRRALTVPSAWQGKQIMLHFGAVDWESEVWVNGKHVGLHRGGYNPFSYDITPYLAASGPNEIVVRVFDPTQKGGQPRGKQNTEPRGITYTPTTGIWQTVWIEPVGATSVHDLTLVPDIDSGHLRLTVNTVGNGEASAVHVAVRSAGAAVVQSDGHANEEMTLAIPNPKLWSPETPHLYSLEITLKDGATTVDHVDSYFAMRKTSVGDSGGQKKLLLNNRFVFQLGPLDQGFWPDGIYTAPTDDALKNDIVDMKAMGFNFVRKHIKVEPARWYYYADTLGLMVWQDMPSCNSYPGKQFTPPPIDKQAYMMELEEMIRTKRMVPAIVMWITFNEGQGQFDTEKAINLVRTLDPTRVINEASGGEIMGFGDVNDVHSYPEPAVRPSNGRQAMTCGEFGGIGFLIKPHSWQGDGHGYIEVDTPEDLLYLYAEYFADVKTLRDNNNLSAVVYTELTDVMTEINGLETYDRVPKLPFAQIRKVNTFQFPAPSYKVVVPTSQSAPQQWSYALVKPGEGWSAKDFNDGSWIKGVGPFGVGEHIGTRWNSPDIWLRRHFNPGALTPEEIERLVFTEFHRGKIEFFINGVQAPNQGGNNRAFGGHYEQRPLVHALRAAILPNAENVLAVHLHNMTNDQFFDAGFSIRVPAS